MKGVTYGYRLERSQEVAQCRRLFVIAVAILAVGFAASAFAGDAAAGKAVYDGAKPACKGCHTDVKNPLTKTGAENTVEQLKAWMRTPKEMIAKRGKKGIALAKCKELRSKILCSTLYAFRSTPLLAGE